MKKEGLLGDFLQFAIEKLDDAQVYIAEKEGEIIGFLCTTLPNPKHLYIEYIGVNPELQGKGIASKIISAFRGVPPRRLR